MSFEPRRKIPGLPPEAERALGEVQTAIARECKRIEQGARSPRRRVTEVYEEGSIIAKPGEVVRVLPGDEDVTVVLPEPTAASDGEDIVISFEGDGSATGKVKVVPASGTCLLPGIQTLNAPGTYRFTSTGGGARAKPRSNVVPFTPSSSGSGSAWSGPPPVTVDDLPAAMAGDGLTGGAGSPLAVGAGDGIDVGANSIAVDVTDLVGSGLENDGSNNLRIAASAAGAGLTGGGGSALAVGAGTGLTVAADAVGLTDMAVGTAKGRRIDAGSTGAPVDLTGLEQAENWRRGTIQTVSGVSGTLDILLNDDTTVLLIRTTGDATLRTLGSVAPSDAGREVVIEHDRLSGTGILTIAHNTAGTYSRFFNPGTTALYIGQTQCLTVRLRSGFWRPQGTASGSTPFRFPGAPIYDVMAPPYNAVGDGVTDDTAAINSAIAAANAVAGTVYLGHRHLVSGALTPVTRDAIVIQGRGNRGDGTLITVTGSTPYNVFTFDTVKDCGLRDVFIEGPGTWASRGLGVFIDDCFRTRIERVEITDTYGGIEIYASVITEIIETYLTDTLGPYGFYAYGSAADGENHALRFIGCATGGNLGGTIAWYKQGSGSHTFELINCGALEGGYGLYVADDTPYTDSSPRFTRCLNFQADHCQTAGIYLVAGATASFTHCFITSTIGGNAFHVTSGYSGNWELNGGMLHATAGHGAYVQGDHWSMTGVQIGNIDAGFDMVHVDSGSSDFSITGCTLGDIFGDNSSAAYGINLHATCTRYTISGNRIIGNDTSAINDGPGPATSRVIQGNNPTSVNTVRIDEIETMTAGTVIGKQVDAATGRPVALTGAEVSELWRRATIQTVSGVSGTLDILLNDDTTVLLIRTTADATLRSLGDGLATGGREIVIEHDRLSGSGNLTVAHNTVGTYSSFFNPDVTDIVLGQTTCTTVRLRSGFWRPQTNSGRVRAADYGDVTVSAGGTTWTIDNDVVSDAKLRNSGALSVIGRSANSSGDPADISATAASGAVLRESGSVLGFGTVATAGIADAAVTLAKLANLAVGTVIGRAIDAGSTGVPTALTGAQQAQQLRYTSVVTDTTSSGVQATYTLAETTTQVRCNTSSDVEVRGMTIPTAQGQRVVFHREPNSAGVWTFRHNTGGGTTQQQFFLSNEQDQVLGEGQSIMFEYTNNRWRHIGGTTTALTDGDKGDVTVSALGLTWTIDNDVVSDAKLRNSAALSVIGRSANSTGDPADIAAANDGEVLRRSGTTLGFGTVATAGIANNAVTDAKLRQGAALTVIGRSANSTGDVADIAAGSDGHVLRRSGTTLGFGTVATAGIADAAVTLAKMADLAQSSIIGRAESAGTGVPQALTSTQVAAIIDGEPMQWTNDHAFTGQSTRITGMFRFDGVSSTASTAANDLAIGAINVLRSTGPLDPLTGMVPSGDGQIVLLVNAHASTNMAIHNESASSSAANRFAGIGTSRIIRPGEMALAWYDGTSDRWRVLCRDEVDL